MERIPDPFPTTTLSVPNLTELVTRLRDPARTRCVTLIHAKRDGEGEWVLANAAARLTRGNVKVFGPELGTAHDVVEHGLRTDAKVIFTGDLRRADDAMAFRKAAAIGVRPVGTITVIRLIEAQMLLEAMGPWTGYDVVLLSVDLPPVKKHQ
ncbi:MAG TPA: hypothetical protein VFE36_15330 [Candidatus Baltobacteraceae bacterium]|nr:hypothetical protein [Candidatus Baltobacteraceae bacterium]